MPKNGNVVIDTMTVNTDILNIMPAVGDVTIKNLIGNVEVFNVIPGEGSVTIENISGQFDNVNIATDHGDITIGDLNIDSNSVSIRANVGKMDIGNIEGNIGQVYISNANGDVELDSLIAEGNVQTHIFASNGNLLRGVIDTGSTQAYLYASGTITSSIIEDETDETDETTDPVETNEVILGGQFSAYIDTLSGNNSFKMENLSSPWASKIVVSVQAIDQQYLEGSFQVDGVELMNLDGKNLYYTTFTLEYTGQLEQLFALNNLDNRTLAIKWWFLP